jgi:hypothetical protein
LIGGQSIQIYQQRAAQLLIHCVTPIDEKRDADETVVAHNRDFRRTAVFHQVQKRYDAVGRKVCVATPDSTRALTQDIAALYMGMKFVKKFIVWWVTHVARL